MSFNFDFQYSQALFKAGRRHDAMSWLLDRMEATSGEEQGHIFRQVTNLVRAYGGQQDLDRFLTQADRRQEHDESIEAIKIAVTSRLAAEKSTAVNARPVSAIIAAYKALRHDEVISLCDALFDDPMTSLATQERVLPLLVRSLMNTGLHKKAINRLYEFARRQDTPHPRWAAMMVNLAASHGDDEIINRILAMRDKFNESATSLERLERRHLMLSKRDKHAPAVSDDAPAEISAPQRSPYSILLMAFGQSNADQHFAGPRIYPSEGGDPADDLPVVMPNDGKDIRGYMGEVARQKITGFVPVRQASPKNQSLLVAAGARLLHDLGDPDLRRVIVRTEARGGRRFLAFHQGDVVVDGIFRDIDGGESVTFNNLIRTIRECIDVSREDGCPIRLVNMVWLHGEADRGMSRAEYGALFLELIEVVESRFADEDVAFEWSVVQPSGTGPKRRGNLWPNRMSVLDVADARENVSVAVAGYPYQQVDGRHYSAYGKLHLGENLGRMIARRVQGKSHGVPRLASAMLQGRDAVMKFTAGDPLFLDGDVTTAPRGTNMGFHAQDCSGAIALEVSVDGDDTLKLLFDRAPDPGSLVINYAYMENPRVGPVIDGDYPFGGGCLRTTASVPSILLEGETLHDWVAGFTVGPFICDPAPQDIGVSGSAAREEEVV